MGEASRNIELWGWRNYFESVSSFLRDLRRNSGIANIRYCEYAADRLEVCLSSAHLLAYHMESASHQLQGESLRHVTQYKESVEQLITYLQDIANEWQGYLDAFYTGEQIVGGRYTVATLSTGQRGRPSREREQLEYLKSLSFSWSDIASILGISRMTLYHHRRFLDEPQQTLTDDQLRNHIIRLPAVGEALVIEYMHSNRFHVTQDRIRQSMHATDPINTSLRWRGNLPSQRPYSVPGPNSLWHIGNVSC